MAWRPAKARPASQLPGSTTRSAQQKIEKSKEQRAKRSLIADGDDRRLRVFAPMTKITERLVPEALVFFHPRFIQRTRLPS
jgi:hypothetical protein